MAGVRPTNPRIVIVGAGMAGISAAHHLVTSGLSNVKILEASDRIGGRIHTSIEFGDGPMPAELGANWIHGAVMANSTFKLADSIGALSPYRIFNRMSGRFLREDGTEIGRDLVTFCWNIYKDVSEKAENVLSTGIKQGRRENIQTVLPRLFFDQVENSVQQSWNKDDITRVFNAFCNWTAFHEGDDLDKISFEFPETTCVMPGGNVHIPRGYKYLLDHLVKFLPENTIEFNTEVVKVQWKTSSDEVIVITRDGKSLAADHVIVTCSLGVLKNTHESLFMPSLPPSKVKVINSIGFGCVNKILLEYDRPVREIKSTNVFLSWLDNKIVDMETDWVKGIVGFDLIYTKQNVLLGWISGKAAEHMETLSDDVIARGCTKLLRNFLGDPSFPEPKNIRVSRWGSNPYTRGSYSYQTPNLIPGEQDTLSEPLNSDSGSHLVLFAGEATHRENYSCTHGARDSGIREANRLLELYKDKVVCAKL